MGSLALPASGEVYFDAQIAIYAVEAHPTFGLPVAPLWRAIAAGGLTGVSSAMTVLEVLVKPYQMGDVGLEQRYEALFVAPGVQIVPITLDILRAAARLRATIPKLRTPDAIHAATARATGCGLFVTNDPVFVRVPGLPVVVLKDVLAAP